MELQDSETLKTQIRWKDIDDLAVGRSNHHLIFTTDQMLSIKQAQLLRSINKKLNLFVVLLILGIVVSFVFSLLIYFQLVANSI